MDPPNSYEYFLHRSKVQLRLSHRSPRGKPYDQFVVGAIIFSPSSPSPPKLLLLKCSPNEEFCPNEFGIPGGNIEDTDVDILHGLKREVRAQTGLEIKAVVGQVDWFPLFAGGDEGEAERSCFLMGFVCEVGEGEVRINPDEHSEARWVTREEAGGLELLDEMQRIVENAFRWEEIRKEGKGAASNPDTGG